MKEINPNANLDVVAIGGSMATVGVGSQIPALNGIATFAVNTISKSCGAAKVGALFAKAVVGTVSAIGAPALIIGGLAIVGCALFSD